MFDTLKLVFDTFGKDLMDSSDDLHYLYDLQSTCEKSIFISSAGWCWSERYDIHYH